MNFNMYFMNTRRKFLNSESAWSKRKININTLFASMKTLANSQDCSESVIITSVSASLSVIGRFSPVSTLIGGWKNPRKCILHVLGGFQYNISGPQAVPVSVQGKNI
jgi:hypothetical protein